MMYVRQLPTNERRAVPFYPPFKQANYVYVIYFYLKLRKQGREVGLAEVGQRGGEKMQTTVIEQQQNNLKIEKKEKNK